MNPFVGLWMADEMENAEADAGPSRAIVRAEEPVSIRQTELFKLMGPWAIYLDVCQLVHVRECNEHASHRLRRVTDSDSRGQKIVLRCLHVARFLWDVAPCATIGAGFVVICVYAVVIKIYADQVEFAGVSMELVALGLLFQNWISYADMYASCESGLTLRLFRAYSQLARDDERQKKRLDAMVVRTSKIALIGCLIMNFFFCLSWQLFLHMACSGKIDMGCFGATFVAILSKNPVAYYTVFWGCFFEIAPFTVMGALISIFCMILKSSYEAVNRQIEESVQDRPGHPSDLDVWPLLAKHRHITQMVNMVSQLFGIYGLTFVLVNIACGCFLAYLVLFSCHTNGLASTIPFGWSMVALLVFSAVAIPGIVLNNRAMGCWKDLNAVRMAHFSSRHGAQLVVFLESVSSKRREIGISPCGFFTLTPKFFIWAISSTLSYFMLLIQLSPPRDFCDSVNSTCSLPHIGPY